uniref:GAG-pre-integrase domain-containing protein n=1 Tax=Cannabis sativa TaxID=3483 RepID=A0A803Q2F6_CANSA
MGKQRWFSKIKSQRLESIIQTKVQFKGRETVLLLQEKGHYKDECRVLKAKLQRDKSKKGRDDGAVTDGYDFKKLDGGSVLLGNNKACKVAGIGTVRIKFHDNQVRLIQDVRGLDMESTRLWHLRLGHVSERGMSELEKQGILKGELGEKLDFCDDCVYGLEIQGNREEDEGANQVDTQELTHSETYIEATKDETSLADSQDYQPVRDRERRQIKSPKRFGFADCTAFALASVEEVDNTVLNTYQEVVNSKNKKKWLAAIDEEMCSL